MIVDGGAGLSSYCVEKGDAVMSVIFFEKEKIEALYSLLEFHLDKVKPIIRCSPYYAMFAREEEKSSGTLKLPFEEDQCEIKFIQLIVYYATVSNWVAYSVQYQQVMDFKELQEIDFDSAPPKPGPLKTLIDDLLHLHYYADSLIILIYFLILK